MSIVKPRGSLRSVIRRYYNGKANSYRDGDWSIAKGGYDCWFEIYLSNQFFISCIGGKLEGVCFPLHYSHGMTYKEAEEYLEKCLKVVMEEAPETYIDKE